MEFITLKTFDNPIDAHILKSKLESEGIISFLFDENIVGINPLFSIAVGGIKLKINRSDYEKANSILDESIKNKLINDAGERIHCPKCKSEDLISDYTSIRGTKGIFTAIISFLLLVLPFYQNTVYKCKSCDFEFKKSG